MSQAVSIAPQIEFSQVRASHWLLLLVAIVAFSVSYWLMPHKTWFEYIGKPDFELIVPKTFGNWQNDNEQSGGIVSPELAAAVNDVYSQVVTRTYVHKASGAVVMLSVGYGNVQIRTKQLHRPESCYSSQGFHIEDFHPETIKIGKTDIGLFRMFGIQGDRQEQVTYWIRAGDKIISGPPKDLNIQRMKLGLRGYISDGLLFRISTLGNDSVKAIEIQNTFIKDLLSSVSPAQQIALIGKPL